MRIKLLVLFAVVVATVGLVSLFKAGGSAPQEALLTTAESAPPALAPAPSGGVRAVARDVYGPKDLEYRMEGDTKVFELTAAPVDWEVQPGKTVKAWGYNGQLPGPTIRVTEGDHVRIIVHNRLPEHHTVHWHGLLVPNAMDGVGGLSQRAIMPGEDFTYEFIIPSTPGTFMYHSHMDDLEQVRKGLYGAFIVLPKTPDVVYDQERLVLLSDIEGNYLVNGKSFPGTEAWEVKHGQTVLIRLINISALEGHPMHLHGHFMQLIAQDGVPLGAASHTLNTVWMAPGTTADAVAVMNADGGTWLFHCHILSHVMGPDPKSDDITKANAGMVVPIKYID